MPHRGQPEQSDTLYPHYLKLWVINDELNPTSQLCVEQASGKKDLPTLLVPASQTPAEVALAWLEEVLGPQTRAHLGRVLVLGIQGKSTHSDERAPTLRGMSFTHMLAISYSASTLPQGARWETLERWPLALNDHT